MTPQEVRDIIAQYLSEFPKSSRNLAQVEALLTQAGATADELAVWKPFIENALDAIDGDLEALDTALAGKQEILIAGENITIGSDGRTISATSGGVDEQWVIDNSITKGTVGTYTQIPAGQTPANEFEFNGTLADFARDKLSNRWFNLSEIVTVNLTRADTTSDVYIQNILGGRIRINSDYQIARFLSLQMARCQVAITVNGATALGTGLGMSNCSGLDLLGSANYGNLNIYSTNNISLAGTTSYNNVTIYPGALGAIMQNVVSINSLTVDGICVIYENVPTTFGSVQGVGHIIDNRPNRPLDTFVKRGQPINMGNQKITNVGHPSFDGDAINLSYLRNELYDLRNMYTKYAAHSHDTSLTHSGESGIIYQIDFNTSCIDLPDIDLSQFDHNPFEVFELQHTGFEGLGITQTINTIRPFDSNFQHIPMMFKRTWSAIGDDGRPINSEWAAIPLDGITKTTHAYNPEPDKVQFTGKFFEYINDEHGVNAKLPVYKLSLRWEHTDTGYEQINMYDFIGSQNRLEILNVTGSVTSVSQAVNYPLPYFYDNISGIKVITQFVDFGRVFTLHWDGFSLMSAYITIEFINTGVA